MKAGDYVRTESYNNIPSKIGRIRNVEFYKGEIKYIFIDNDEDKNRCYDMSSIRGMSPNIIDLIEENDLIKIEYYSLRYEERVTRLFEVYYKDNKFVNLGNAKCEFMLVNGDFNDNDKKLEPIIKSIVTKEQFESMEYKVGE